MNGTLLGPMFRDNCAFTSRRGPTIFLCICFLSISGCVPALRPSVDCGIVAAVTMTAQDDGESLRCFRVGRAHLDALRSAAPSGATTKTRAARYVGDPDSRSRGGGRRGERRRGRRDRQPHGGRRDGQSVQGQPCFLGRAPAALSGRAASEHRDPRSGARRDRAAPHVDDADRDRRSRTACCTRRTWATAGST